MRTTHSFTMGGLCPRSGSPYRDSPGQRSPWTETPQTETPQTGAPMEREPPPPWTQTPWTERNMEPGTETLLWWDQAARHNDWHTPVKILLCSRLRSRAVKIGKSGLKDMRFVHVAGKETSVNNEGWNRHSLDTHSALRWHFAKGRQLNDSQSFSSLLLLLLDHK